jgi:diketogulonate reductase-like aldo/keto reductase
MTHVQPLIDLHEKYNIVTQAYASLAPTTRHPTGGPLKPILARIADKLSSESGVEVDSSGVLLLWIMTRGGICITSSSDSGRIKKMADLEKVRDLSKVELEEIDAAGKQIHFRQWVCCIASPPIRRTANT